MKKGSPMGCPFGFIKDSLRGKEFLNLKFVTQPQSNLGTMGIVEVTGKRVIILGIDVSDVHLPNQSKICGAFVS